MSFQIFGLPVSRGVAIGRAVLVASSRVDVAHYFIDETQVVSEIDRLRAARDAVATELGALQRDMPVGCAAGAVGAARRAPDAAARRDAHRSDQALDPRDGTTTPSGRCRRSSRCWRASSTRWRTSTCASARPISSRWWSGCCARWRAGPRRRAGGARGARLRRRGSAGIGGQRHFAGRHAAVQAQRVHRLHHRRRWQDLAHRHRRAQPGHSCGGRRARGESPDPPGRLAGDRRRRRHRGRQPVAHRARGIPLQAAAERARAGAPVAAAAYAGGDAGRRARRTAGQHRAACGRDWQRSRRARWVWACSAASSCS